MKKTYQNPTTDIVIISVVQMIAASDGGLLGNDDKPNNLDLENIAETDATEGNLSRRRTVWDDEEEEEEY